ncbi:MAG: hypothetical protein HKM02_07615 [Pseudomonadales bacterium]|nr:hypothetical protein [Pseudomonadales bacterium]
MKPPFQQDLRVSWALCQLALGLMALSMAAWHSCAAAGAALEGVAVAWVASLWWVWQAYRFHAALGPALALQGMYRAEFGKMLFACLLLGVLFKAQHGWQAGYLLLGYSLPQLGMWLVLAMQGLNKWRIGNSDKPSSIP